jgi:tetratricopeptide (TPR) repeat protein
LGEEPGREFLVSIDRLKRKLQSERIGILIDNLEPALDSAGKFIEPHRSYVELLRILADPSVQSVTLITSRERLNEYSVSIQPYLLRELSLEAWKQFFQNQFARTFEEIDDEALEKLQNAYGGNAKAMSILCGAILTDYSGNIAAYWEENQNDLLIERALEDLVVGQFDRLQQLDLDAYNLLCRMGCYRYQDVPTVPIEGLFCLLWDVAENRRRRVVKALQERSLVDCVEGEYWLHPVIRGEAIGRIKDNEGWELANQKAADFWTESVGTIENVDDALRAFEAYFQCMEICDYQKAGDIIALGRYSNQSSKIQSLGGSLIRLGVWQPIISEVSRLVDKLPDDYGLSNIYRILTNAYLLTGQIRKAAEYSEKSGNIAKNRLQEMSQEEVGSEAQYRLKMLYRVSFANIGLCKILLREIQEAALIFHNLISNEEMFTKSSKTGQTFVYEFCALAYLYSNLGVEKETKFFAEKAYDALLRTKHGDEIWTIGYGTLFLGIAYQSLRNYDLSSELFHKAIDHTERTSYFVQIKANALTGLAVNYRENQDFVAAFSSHSLAIDILEPIGARSDLAEAYYQLGLTCKGTGEAEKSDKHFQKAIHLFVKMEAPKQVERVRRSMENHDP